MCLQFPGLAVILCTSLTAPTNDPNKQCRAILDELREKQSVPALAAAVVHGAKIEAVGVVGVRVVGEDDPVLVTDRFHIGSCTKSMTAMLAAMLVEEGKLRWDTTLSEALPDLKGRIHDAYLDVQLLQVLSHTGGLPPYTNFGPAKLDEFLAFTGTHPGQRVRFITEALAQPPESPPGNKELYSNAGYAVAGAIIERAAGSTWEGLVRERIFRPLQMETAGFGWPATTAAPGQPRGHTGGADGQSLRPQRLDDTYKLPACLWPAGAVQCSIEDLGRYAREHLNGLKGSGKLLRPETYRKLHTTWNDQPDGLTLGWGRRVDPKFGSIHYGAGSGGTFFVRIWIAPESDLAIVAATNCGNPTVTKEVIEKLSEFAQRPKESGQ